MFDQGADPRRQPAARSSAWLKNPRDLEAMFASM
jgi:hypothetical protein